MSRRDDPALAAKQERPFLVGTPEPPYGWLGKWVTELDLAKTKQVSTEGHGFTTRAINLVTKKVPVRSERDGIDIRKL
jgi:hypothetical protein